MAYRVTDIAELVRFRRLGVAPTEERPDYSPYGTDGKLRRMH
jgi:hypothetical protein